MGYHILDYDIELVSEFGLCYKNKLPMGNFKLCISWMDGKWSIPGYR